MVVCFDLDKTLCKTPYIDPYSETYSEIEDKLYSAEPIAKMISKLVSHIDQGDRVFIHTTRSDLYYDVTLEWIRTHIPVNVTEIIFNKPFYDILYDDKAENFEI